jgi:hypothetical protein
MISFLIVHVSLHFILLVMKTNFILLSFLSVLMISVIPLIFKKYDHCLYKMSFHFSCPILSLYSYPSSVLLCSNSFTFLLLLFPLIILSYLDLIHLRSAFHVLKIDAFSKSFHKNRLCHNCFIHI